MWIADKWNDYELIDTSEGEKLERWGKYILIRPDPQVIWHTDKKHQGWKRADAVYSRSSSGGGSWSVNKLPKEWYISYRELKFVIRPMGFKHTGLFPEQAANWDWFSSLIKESARPIKVLNLFAYTGGATVAAAAAGASVCHVDASKGMVAQAKENAALSGLADAPIRYIVDDCKKFVEREIRRGNKYDAVIMDPPSYGRGPKGEVWTLEEKIFDLISLCTNVLSDNPAFFIVNSYTTGLAPTVLYNMLEMTVGRKFGGKTQAEEIGLPIENSSYILPCGSTGRWIGEI
jgi:23S rRNA (cytosine1962-C5)-methyltransferase